MSNHHSFYCQLSLSKFEKQLRLKLGFILKRCDQSPIKDYINVVLHSTHIFIISLTALSTLCCIFSITYSNGIHETKSNLIFYC